jgi:hypothetical protein
MTHAEHGLVARFVSILLLGFLLPHSTGNEFFVTQHATTAVASTNSTTRSTITFDNNNNNNNKLPLVLELPLEERLEHAALFYTTTPTPPGRCTDGHVNLAFWVFLQSLSTYLQATSWFIIDHDHVDLWHIMAMAIDPSSSSTTPPPPPFSKHKGIARARQFMQSLVPHSFYLPYGHCRLLVQMVGHDLVLPRFLVGNKDGDDDDDDPYHVSLSPWLEGAIYHLRSSLSNYAMSAVSLADAHAAHVALANLTVQTMGNPVFPTPEEEWNRYLARMVDDRGHYGCSGCWLEESSSSPDCDGDDGDDFCPHAARGRLLDNFFSRIVQQSTANHNDKEDGDSQRRHFITHALSSLADAVEWQVDCWTTPPSDEQESQKRDSPCLLASLLHASKSLSYFLKETKDADREDDDEEEDNEGEQEAAKTSLLRSVIQLVHHPNRSVACQASILVSLAFSQDNQLAGGQQLLLESVKAALESQAAALCRDEAPLQLSNERGQLSMISTASRQSRSFASSLLLFILSKRRETWKSEKFDDQLASTIARWVVTICQAQPWVSLKYRKELIEFFQQENTRESQSHLSIAILSGRLAYFFAKPEQESQVNDLVLGLIKQDTFDSWKALQVARHCLVSGNFAMAKDIYQHLVQYSVSEKSFLWLSTLMKVAQAESVLESHATKGIPAATIDLQAAFSNLVALQSHESNSCFRFLTKFIRLRMEFLDLIAALRHFIIEMRLTGSGPIKFTRSAWHVQNIPQCFEGLAYRYHSLYRQYGLFLNQQSRTALRTVQASCHFVASVSRKAFAEFLGDVRNKLKEEHNGHHRSGDSQHPLTSLTRRLNDLVVKDMSGLIDPMTRAAATLEVLDGVLMTPIPIPRDLSIMLPLASLRLTADPEQAAEMHSTHTSGPFLKVIEAFPRLSFKFVVNGSVSPTFASRATIPFFTFMCTYKIVYTGPLHDNDENQADEKHEEDDATIAVVREQGNLAGWKFTSSEPLMAPISPSRRFFVCVECPPLLHEGSFCLTVRPLLRDIRGGEWTLPVVDESDLSIPIRVSRSRDI